MRNFIDDDNFIIDTDSYKVTHANQYPPNTNKVYSYFEARGFGKETVFFGLQSILQEYFDGEVVCIEDIEVAEEYFAKHFNNPELFNKKGWKYIVNEHGGMLPLKIRAVPEGTVVPTSNVLMTVENTDPKCWWLTNYVETMLTRVWYPTTVATISREMKKVIAKGLVDSGSLNGLLFKLHDFGSRGVSSRESAKIGGAAHLVNFLGTDTLICLPFVRAHYDADMAGFSIPASEHSTITSWGEEGELESFKNMLKQFPTGPVAVVSDSWNIYRACKKLLGQRT